MNLLCREEMLTIKDIAKEAHVGVGTVSRYINNTGYVSEATKDKIEKAIVKFDYVPNQTARTLITKSSKFVGFLVPTIRNPFFSEVVSKVENILWNKGYVLVVCNVEGDSEKELGYINFLRQNYVAGLIVATNNSKSTIFNNINIPLVAFDRIINSEIPYVTSKNKIAGEIAARTLIERGAKKILYVSGNLGVKTAEDRYIGFLEETKKHKDVIKDVIFSDDETCVEKELLISKIKEGYDGLVIWNEKTASNALMIINQLNINIPDELQIISFDGLSIGETTYPQLTTIKQDISGMADLTVKLLFDQMNEKKNIKVANELDVKVIFRETTLR